MTLSNLETVKLTIMKEYLTNDRALAAALTENKQSCKGTRKADSTYTSFVFEDTEELRQIVTAFYDRILMVDARTYSDNLNSMLYRTKESTL